MRHVLMLLIIGLSIAVGPAFGAITDTKQPVLGVVTVGPGDTASMAWHSCTPSPAQADSLTTMKSPTLAGGLAPNATKNPCAMPGGASLGVPIAMTPTPFY